MQGKNSIVYNVKQKLLKNMVRIIGSLVHLENSLRHHQNLWKKNDRSLNMLTSLKEALRQIKDGDIDYKK